MSTVEPLGPKCSTAPPPGPVSPLCLVLPLPLPQPPHHRVETDKARATRGTPLGVANGLPARVERPPQRVEVQVRHRPQWPAMEAKEDLTGGGGVGGGGGWRLLLLLLPSLPPASGWNRSAGGGRLRRQPTSDGGHVV